MFNLYSIKTQLLFAVTIGIIILILLLIFNFLFIYKNSIMYEEKNVKEYSDFLTHDLDKYINDYFNAHQINSINELKNFPDFYKEILSEINEPKDYTWEVLITDKTGMLLYHSHKKVNLKDKKIDFSWYPSIRNALNGNWGLNLLQIENKLYYCSSEFIKPTGWILVIQIPFLYIFMNVLQIILPSIIMILIIFLVFIILTIIWANRFISPLSLLARSIRNYNEPGSTKILEKYNINTADSRNEMIGAISSFMKMVEERKTLEIDILEMEETQRRKIAAILHDEFSRFLSDLLLKLRVLTKDLNETNDNLHFYINDIIENVNNLITRTRQIEEKLSPLAHYKNDFLLAVEQLVNKVQTECKIDCKLDYSTDIYFKNELIANNLYRIIFEAFDIFCTGSAAERINVVIKKSDFDMLICITFYGEFYLENENVKNSIKIMKYRAKLISSTFRITEISENSVEIKCKISILSI